MSAPLHLLARLGVAPDADARAIRRAYARELKQIDQEADPAGFQSLREAYDAALYWESHHDAMAPEEAEPVAAITAAATAADDGHEAGQAPQQDQQALAAVFDQFRQRCAALVRGRATQSDVPWQEVLRTSMQDQRLVSIMARDLFEQQVADWLAQGWQPGNEALFPAATKVFHWNDDRRRVQALGRTGFVLDTAIDEYAIFVAQDDEDLRRLVKRLRKPNPPSAREVVMNTAAMDMLVSRFPTWLGLVVNADHVVRWREMDRTLPGWRRKLTLPGWRKGASDGGQQQSGMNWGWLIFVGLMILGRMASHDSGTSTTPRESYASVIATADKRLSAGDFDGAAASYTRAIQLDAGQSYPYLSRARVYLQSGGGDDDKILADLDKAGALDKSNDNVPRVRGLLAMKHHRDQEAIAEFTRSLQLKPNHPYTLDRRAEAYASSGQPDKALADVELRLKNTPDASVDAYWTRIRIHAQRGERAKMAEQIEAMINANKDNPNAYGSAANLLNVLNQPDQALNVLDRGIAAAPNGTLYLWRATLRPKTDIAGRRADIQYAVALAPATLQLLRERVALEIDDGKLDVAEKILSDEIKAGKAGYADQPIMLAYRAIVHGKMGKPSLADEDLKAARAAAGTRLTLNNLAWFLAQHQTALPQALSAVNAALDQEPGSGACLDTKGMILLQMGRYLDSLDVYNAALKLRPGMANSLFGRGMARRRSGDKAGGDADLLAARQEYPGIDREYANYGLKP